MKTPARASVVLLSILCCIAGCDSLSIPNFFGPDQVPPEVKNAPRIVASPPLDKSDESWPRLGDVPGRPKNLTPTSEYERDVQELQQERAESEAVKKDALQNALSLRDAASQKTPAAPVLQPPQFLGK